MNACIRSLFRILLLLAMAGLAGCASIFPNPAFLPAGTYWDTEGRGSIAIQSDRVAFNLRFPEARADEPATLRGEYYRYVLNPKTGGFRITGASNDRAYVHWITRHEWYFEDDAIVAVKQDHESINGEVRVSPGNRMVFRRDSL